MQRTSFQVPFKGGRVIHVGSPRVIHTARGVVDVKCRFSQLSKRQRHPGVLGKRSTLRRGEYQRISANGEKQKVTVKDLFPSSSVESAAEVNSEPEETEAPQLKEVQVPQPKEEEGKKRGFTEGKSWGTLFEEGLPDDEETMNERLKELSHLDRLLAIGLSEAALPGSFAIFLASIFHMQPFAYAQLDKGALLAAATVLPLLLVDIYLFYRKPKELEEDSEEEEQEVNEEGVVTFVYSMEEAIDDYPAFARDNLSVIFVDTPLAWLVPVVFAAATAQELLYRGVFLGGLSYLVSDALVEAGMEGAVHMPWNSDALWSLTGSQLLSLPQPPLLLAAAIALTMSTLVESMSLMASRENDSSVQLTMREDDLDDLDSQNIPVSEQSSITVELAERGAQESEGRPGEGSLEPGFAHEEPSLTHLEITILNSPKDVDAVRSVLQSLLLSIQFLVSGNLWVPALAAGTSNMFYLILVQIWSSANPPEDDDGESLLTEPERA
mmetsp:Transcript_5691/g.11609  ORF Transcript_5691/g.11609 Transcript_5691/m.11609 type:complete len:495 (-) Transcript_5691:240-1724(-)|eukprot:CAMPEP_0118927496 /NCGR_PEP_ID=MMETSP1169-20130426/4954_1 /TAXON_ID=36882 /ORGANISM="Pyramimonas obovata, Strain CCMP722" /LENGTH=494 /DNA_ID=CAMNT_0006869261 /DNA_START=249 /DNA_END=1733 /DNA_ORIENTATION=-